MIKVIGKRLLIPNRDRLIGFEGDNQTGRLYFSFQKSFINDAFGTETGLSFSAKLQDSTASKATAYVLTPVTELSDDREAVYELEIRSGMLKKVGEIKLQLLILKDMGKDENQADIPDLEWNSETQSFYACDSLDFETYSGTDGEAQLDAFKAILAKIGAESTKAAESASAASESETAAEEYAQEASEQALAASASATAAFTSAQDASKKATEAQSAAGTAERQSSSAKAASESAAAAAALASESAATASKNAGAASTAKADAESAKASAEEAKAAAEAAAINAANAALISQAAAETAKESSDTAAEAAEVASDNAESSLLHMKETERLYKEVREERESISDEVDEKLKPINESLAAKLTKTTEFYPVDRVYGVNMAGEQVMLEAHRDFNSDGGIPVYDNNGVIKTGTPAKDTDSVNKKYVDDKAAGKLDKVKSDFILYPGIYATTDTDGTPYLIIATSNLGYIGKGSGYIATYDGGELKTGTPTSDDSAANKAYVDEKAKVSDVKVAGTSVVADGTANIPNVLALGDDGKLRVANAPDKTKWTGPLGVDNTGLLTTAGANNIVINNRNASSIQLLNCAYLDYAVKAAMCDGKGTAWTDTEKAAARERMGIKDYKLLATLNFTENASTFTLATLNGQPIALKSMAVIMNRIGDGESANGHITPVFTVKGANGASTNIKGGYFYGVGANGNCWYTRAEISGEFFDSESACMAPSTNSQLGNGWMTTELSKNMDWRNLSDDFLPITQITGFKITASGNCITNGSTMWIYGKEE